VLDVIPNNFNDLIVAFSANSIFRKSHTRSSANAEKQRVMRVSCACLSRLANKKMHRTLQNRRCCIQL